MSLRVQQKSQYQGKDRWKWSVWIEGPAKELAQVDSVIYTLHPTFRNPVQIFKDRARKFRLDSAGWGEFKINVAINRKDGKVLKREHWLKLTHPRGVEKRRATRKQPAVFLSYAVTDAALANALRHALKNRDIQVLTGDDIPPALPLQESIRFLADRANAGVAIISDVQSPWVVHELDYLKERRLPVIPVTVGQQVKMPERLKGVKTIRLRDVGEVESIADQLAKEIMSKAVWE